MKDKTLCMTCSHCRWNNHVTFDNKGLVEDIEVKVFDKAPEFYTPIQLSHCNVFGIFMNDIEKCNAFNNKEP